MVSSKAMKMRVFPADYVLGAEMRKALGLLPGLALLGLTRR